MNDIDLKDMIDKEYIIIEAEMSLSKLFAEIITSIDSEKFQNLQESLFLSSMREQRISEDRNYEKFLH